LVNSPQLRNFEGAAAVSAPPPAFSLGERLLVLTRDEALVATLRNLGSQHDIVKIAAEADLASHLLGDHAGVAILDAAAAVTPIGQLAERLKAQFPDLVLIVAGLVEHQSALAAQITSGAVYRFLHKPVSLQRVKLFVDAAWRRHDETLAGADDFFTATGVLPAERTAVPAGLVTAGGITLCVLVAVAGWFMTHKPQARPASAPVMDTLETPAVAPVNDEQLEDLLARADQALAAGSLLTPVGTNAADLYQRARQRNADDPRPAAGIEKVIDRLLSAAEEQLQTQHLDEAQKLTEQARALKPDHVRVAYVTATIGKEKERALLTQARRAASSGHLEQAIAVLEGASREDTRSALVTEARNELQQKKADERVSGYLLKATERMQQGHLIEPAEDNAQFFIESARALAPDDNEVRLAEHRLLDRLVTEARMALAAGNADEGARWIAAAADSGASPDDLTALSREVERVRTTVKANAMARLTMLFNQRIAQGRVIDPPSDSAKFYLAQLTQSDANHPSTLLARQSFDARTLEEARGALRRQDYTGAHHWLAEARAGGADEGGVAALERDIAAVQNSTKRVNEIVLSSSLQRTRYVAPVFPIQAREHGTTGWVDVQFVVRTDGSVGDVVIIGAEPVGMFEQSAMEAVRKWRYQPTLRNGQAIDQHVRLRLRFAMDK